MRWWLQNTVLAESKLLKPRITLKIIDNPWNNFSPRVIDFSVSLLLFVRWSCTINFIQIRIQKALVLDVRYNGGPKSSHLYAVYNGRQL